MQTLNLTRKHAGHYVVESAEHIVSVSTNAYLSGLKKSGWYAQVEKKTHVAKDFEGNLVQMSDQLWYCYADTKKDAVYCATNWILENF